jgi:hypothetical protein
MGIGPRSEAWAASVLPLNYTHSLRDGTNPSVHCLRVAGSRHRKSLLVSLRGRRSDWLELLSCYARGRGFESYGPGHSFQGFSSPSNAQLLAHNGEQPGIAVQRQHQKETSAVAGPSLLIMVCYRLRKSFHL